MVKLQKILVGVDGSATSLKAFEWARDVAIDNGGELTVLMTWRAVAPTTGGSSFTYSTRDDTPVSTQATEQLMAAIRAVLGENPPILVRPVVKEGNTAKALIDASDGMDLLVVGNRGIGGFAGLLLGSTSHHVAAHAKCPVVVVR